MRTKTTFAFALALSTLLFFPSWHLFFFAPYLVVTFYACSRLAALWRALGCGLLIDLLSSTPFFGLTSLTYVLVALLLYGQKRNFFEDRVSTLPLMTFLFSFLATLLYVFLLALFGKGMNLTLPWVFTDLFLFPLLDALYALCAFALPFQLTAGLTKLKFYAYFRKKYRR